MYLSNIMDFYSGRGLRKRAGLGVLLEASRPEIRETQKNLILFSPQTQTESCSIGRDPKDSTV